MAFDKTSLDKLAALGRRLPTPLPVPEPRAKPNASEGRHPVETETNPERLFQQLMQASSDGSVPPHLLDRLKQIEAQTLRSGTSSRSDAPSSPRRAVRRAGPAAQTPDPLYVAFEQLLLEDDPDS